MRTLLVGGTIALTLGLAPAQDLEAQRARFRAAVNAFHVAEGDAAIHESATEVADLFFRLPAAERQAWAGEGLSAYLALGRNDLAVEVARALDRDQENRNYLGSRLVAYARSGLLEPFLRLVDVVLAAEKRPSSGASEVLTAGLQYALRREEAAVLPLADQALRTGRTEHGRELFARMADLEPPQAYRFSNLALCLRNLGDIDGAKQAYDRALELQPGDAQTLNDLGLLHRATGDTAAALRTFRKSYAQDTAVPGGQAGQGPAVTNLLYHVAMGEPDVPVGAPDPLDLASKALAVRPEARMLGRLTIDVTLDRIAASRTGKGKAPGSARDR